jgi:hypothetical protein
MIYKTQNKISIDKFKTTFSGHTTGIIFNSTHHKIKEESHESKQMERI